MNRRSFLKGAAALLGVGMSTAVRAARRPPNILFILIDDLGWRDLGCFGGSEFETPNIDRLADQGMRFTQAYANCPVCSPSRAALMTGKTPARLGFSGHITAIMRHRHPEKSRIIPPDDRMYLALEETTLAEGLKRAGYVSASIGKWHMGEEPYWPEHQGFDKNIGGWTHGSPPNYFDPYHEPEKKWNSSLPTLPPRGEGEYLTDRLTDEAIGFIENNQDNPFFVYLTHYAVHTPLQAPRELVEKYRKKFEGRDTGIHPVYAAMVENVDTNVGRLLTRIDDLGLTDDTVVIFFSDNGGLKSSSSNAPLREGKAWLYEGGIRVPLIIKWPGHVPEASECGTPVIGSDLFPTLINIAGVEGNDPTLDGVDIAPLWQGADRLARDTLYWYYPHYLSISMRPGAAIRKGDYKLIENYDPPGVELFNLAEDLSEQNNLAKAMPDKAAELLADLNNYLYRVNTIRPTPNPKFEPKKNK